jgi:opacity protein-like surface antigen
MKPRLLLLAASMLLGSPALAAPPSTRSPDASKRPSYARAHRLALNLGFGFGSADLSQLHRGVDDISVAFERDNAGLTLQSSPKSGIQINAEIAFRYYFPYYLLAQVGVDAVYNKASADYSGGPYRGSISNDNLALEVPILVGGYYPFFGRLYVFGAAGPTVVIYPRVFWDPGPDFKADTTVGAHVLVGADFMLAEHVSLGLELRYRYLRTGELKDKDSGIVVTSGMLLGDGSSSTYNLDLSGVSLAINLRFYLL